MTEPPRRFYCHQCRRWTDREEYDEDDVAALERLDVVEPSCGTCGEFYLCDECGARIDERGQCRTHPDNHHVGEPQ